MSKVKIEGHGTGTGTFTVTTPSSNTDRTITLPDSTDTLAVNSDVTNKLPLAGGSMTGNLVVGGGAAPRISITSNNANGSSAVNFLSTTNNSKNWEVGSNLHNSDGLEFTPSTANGNSTFTTPTVSFPVAGGITFGSDTAAANALDDYEEGTFTLAMYSGQSGTITNTTANYTKIGRNVTLNFFGNINNATGNSFVRISGFPFSLPNIGIQVTAYYNQRQVIGLYFSSGGYFYYQNTVVGGNNAGQDTSWLDASTGIAFNVTYII